MLVQFAATLVVAGAVGLALAANAMSDGKDGSESRARSKKKTLHV